jgi:hypothetical protein
MNGKKFSFRGFISFTLFISFFMITVTGIVLYLTPPGRVAKWVNWTLLGFTKEQWQAQHTLFSLLFLILSVFHIFTLNWRTFLHYIKKKTSTHLNMKKEMFISVVLSLVFFFGTMYQVPPFQTIMDFGEYLTESWEQKDSQAPMPHTESLTLTQLSQKVFDNLSPNQIVNKLIKAGIKGVSVDKTLAEIGKENEKSPFELYKIISSNEKAKQQDFSSLLVPGSGIGRKTLKEVASIAGQDVNSFILKLKAQGIEATKDEKIKDLASKSDLTPIEFMKLLAE